MPQDQPARARRTRHEGMTARAPGLWQAALIAACSAALFAALARAPQGREAAAGAPSQLAEVQPADLQGALSTVDASSEELAGAAERKSCGRKLAWVTVMRSPGQPDGRIRLQSGGYFSPAFELTDRPVRVALPYPAPYETGHGTIAVLGATADAVVALTPAWPVVAGLPSQRRQVTWHPFGACMGPGR